MCSTAVSTDSDIFTAATLLYYSSPSISTEFNDIAVTINATLDAIQPNTLFEYGVVGVFGYFIDKRFQIGCTANDVAGHLPPPSVLPVVPANWLQNVDISVVNNMVYSGAVYYVKSVDQLFTLSFFMSSVDDSLAVNLFHIQNQRSYSCTLTRSDITGLREVESRYRFAVGLAHCVHKAFELPVSRAMNNNSPPVGTPIAR